MLIAVGVAQPRTLTIGRAAPSAVSQADPALYKIPDPLYKPVGEGAVGGRRGRWAAGFSPPPDFREDAGIDGGWGDEFLALSMSSERDARPAWKRSADLASFWLNCVRGIVRRDAVSTAALSIASALSFAAMATSASPASPDVPARTSIDATAGAGFWLTREAVVVVEGAGSDAPYFQVRVRMNRSLPVDRHGVRANFLVDTAGSDADPVPLGKRARHCYASSVGNDAADPNLSGVKPGSKVRLTVRITGYRRIVRTVTLRSPHYIKLRTLGCGVRR